MAHCDGAWQERAPGGPAVGGRNADGVSHSPAPTPGSAADSSAHPPLPPRVRPLPPPGPSQSQASLSEGTGHDGAHTDRPSSSTNKESNTDTNKEPAGAETSHSQADLADPPSSVSGDESFSEGDKSPATQATDGCTNSSADMETIPNSVA